MSLEIDGTWKSGVWATTVWAAGVWREGAPVTPGLVSPQRAGVRRARRSYVEIDGEIREVEGHAEAERLLNQLRKEEKKQEKQRKQLKVLLGKAEKSLGIDGALYKKTQTKVEALEVQMDSRQERIEELYSLILKNLEDEISQDDEEVLLLS